MHQVDIEEDQTSPEQLRDSFRGTAADKVSASSILVVEHVYLSTLLAVRYRIGSAAGTFTSKRHRLLAADDAIRSEWCRRAGIRLRSMVG